MWVNLNGEMIPKKVSKVKSYTIPPRWYAYQNRHEDPREYNIEFRSVTAHATAEPRTEFNHEVEMPF